MNRRTGMSSSLKVKDWDIFVCLLCWWLVELPMWLTDGFSVTCFGSWKGQCAYTLIPVWRPYTVINVQGGGGGGETNIRKLRKFGNFKICIKVTGNILGHIGSHKWKPS